MNGVGFLKSFDACVSHSKSVSYGGARIDVFGPIDLRGRDMGGYRAHIRLGSGQWRELDTVYPTEAAAEKAAKQLVDVST